MRCAKWAAVLIIAGLLLLIAGVAGLVFNGLDALPLAGGGVLLCIVLEIGAAILGIVGRRYIRDTAIFVALALLLLALLVLYALWLLSRLHGNI
jgi:hypothetical protein